MFQRTSEQLWLGRPVLPRVLGRACEERRAQLVQDFLVEPPQWRHPPTTPKIPARRQRRTGAPAKMIDPPAPRASTSPADRHLPWLVLLFVGSGCAALIYEIVWYQLLSLIVGSSAISLGVLLATFMGGMCIGSVGLARVVSTRPHPLRVYALLEAGIGAFGLLVLWLLPHVG